MTQVVSSAAHRPLLEQLGWFIRLRWLAGLAVLAAAVFQWWPPGWRGTPPTIGATGAAILLYNAILWAVMRRLGSRAPKAALRLMAWAQLLLDFAGLTSLLVLTGGVNSPLAAFFVFHMIFASMLLSRLMAYGSAGVAMLMVAVGLWVSGQWPVTRTEATALLAWVVVLLVSVWLTSGITRKLRRQRRRLLRQNRRIAAMSRELARQQQAMIQHEKMATAGRMAAGVSHEIANPLASMDGLLQLMQRRPEKLRPDAIDKLREQVDRIHQIVRRMTEFAHPGQAEWKVLPLNDIVEGALEVIRFDPRWKRVRLERQYAPDAPPVRHLAGTIQQVIINLAINALDAMEQTASPHLLIQTSAAEGWACVQIRDNGHGIAPQDLPRLFEPFFTTKPVGKGTGLGLSISYSLLAKQGGSISASSDGKGATFTIRLPLVGSGVAAVQGSAAPADGN